MLNLFLDTTNDDLVFVIEKNGSLLEMLQLDACRNQSELFIPNLKKILLKHKLKLSDFNNCYLLNGPGSYMGTKVGLTFAKTLKILNNNIVILTMNSMKFQTFTENSISLINARGNKWYCGVYGQNCNTIYEKLIFNNELEDIKKDFPNYKIVVDYKNVDYYKNFYSLRSFFQEVEDISKLEPIFL
ncbi:hypothetical protein [Spiroplasma endosymbiont of Amphibalanus improvisus]|uniref:hypothetical protein n=1 Tax=Spiroplasma endosymbiont of Amphibalanus improvisus TaxID=3066327 RepID=UPI00313B120F